MEEVSGILWSLATVTMADQIPTMVCKANMVECRSSEDACRERCRGRTAPEITVLNSLRADRIALEIRVAAKEVLNLASLVPGLLPYS